VRGTNSMECFDAFHGTLKWSINTTVQVFWDVMLTTVRISNVASSTVIHHLKPTQNNFLGIKRFILVM
jgi:hypothetical protein